MSAGGNLGGRDQVIERFQEVMRRLPWPVRASRVYRTAPVGPVADQPDFFNIALELEVDATPEALLSTLRDIESALGRDRAVEQRFGPRALDLDIVLCGDFRSDTDELTVPHPRMYDRAFVLAPLADLVGEGFELPNGQTIGACLAALAGQRVEAVTREALRPE